MRWSDDGIILSANKHGESSVILHALTRENGLHAGLVRGGSGSRLRGVLQPGNSVGLNWNGRLAEHLGSYTIEAKSSGTPNLFNHPLSLAALSSALGLIRKVLPEREAHPQLFEATSVLINNLEHSFDHWGPLFVKWELGLLQELGYGLNLKECIATGSRENLIYVSPKSAAAVSSDAGEPYRDKLLKLPAFLGASQSESLDKNMDKQLLDGLTLSGYFIHKNLLTHYSEESLPARERFLNLLRKSLQKKS